MTSLDELRRDKTFFYNQVILPNIQAAEKVAHAMLNLGGAVIAPSIFEAKSLGWNQDEYMGLWLDTIERKATRLAMVDGWEYSNGGCEEYLQALLMQGGRRGRNNIAIVSADGKILKQHIALQMMLDAVIDLLNRGFTPTTLIQVLYRCTILHKMIADESEYGILTDTCGKSAFSISQHYIDGVSEHTFLRGIYPNLRNLFTDYSHLLRSDDRMLTSSMDLYPGLIRSSNQEDLKQSRASVRRLSQTE